MSYIQSTIRCDDCGKEMNVAFMYIGNSTIMSWPTTCPYCRTGTHFTKIVDGWHAQETDAEPQA